MRVILLEDITNIGKKYDIKNVADGYVRNYLLPRKLVKPATTAALKELGVLKIGLEKEDIELRKHLEELARRLGERHLDFELKVDDKGNIFGSVNKDTILKSLRGAGLVTKERVEIKLDHPLKKLGEHLIPIDLKKGIKSEIKVIIRPRL